MFCGCRCYSGEQNGLNQIYYFRALSSEIIKCRRAAVFGRSLRHFLYIMAAHAALMLLCPSFRAAPKNHEKRSAVQESQGRVAVLDGRQPAFVLRLALRSLPLRLFSHYFWELLIFQIFKCFGYFCDIRVLQRPHQRKRGAVYAKDSVG